MLKVGLTGGVACGKSTVAQMLAARGAHVLDADAVARELFQPGELVYDEIVKCFGREVLRADGTIDRAKVAELAFGGGRVKELNAIVHPAVLERQDQWLNEIGRRDAKAIAVIEAALILEAGVGDHFDKMIVVTCRPEQRVERFAARQHLDAATARREVERRMAAQWSEERKISAADYVIDNSGSTSQTEARIHGIYAGLKKLAAETT